MENAFLLPGWCCDGRGNWCRYRGGNRIDSANRSVLHRRVVTRVGSISVLSGSKIGNGGGGGLGGSATGRSSGDDSSGREAEIDFCSTRHRALCLKQITLEDHDFQ